MATRFGLALAGAVLLAFAFTGCDNPVNGGNGNDVSISVFRDGAPAPANFDLWVAPYGPDNALRGVQLAARIIPGTAYYQNAVWTSSHPERAAVSDAGYVTAVAAGAATITATTAAGRTASVNVNVRGYEPETEAGDPGELAGNLIILQAAAVAGGTGNNANRTFVELHNRSNAAISLDGLSLQYALGQGYTWNVIPLSGNIPAGHSFLILGIVGYAGARLELPDGDADMLIEDFQLNNRAFRLALMEGTVPLTVHNPSDLSHDGIDLRHDMPAANATEPSGATVGTEIAAGLIDLLGVVNTRADDRDIMHGAKGHPAYRISNQTSIRRANLNAPTNNFNDFTGLRWAAPTSGEPLAVADDQLAVFRPRNLEYGAWAPTFPEMGWQFTVPPSIAIQHDGSTITSLLLSYGGDDVQLSALVTPATAGPVTWNVSHGTAVTVSPEGLVSTAAIGTATITASVGELSAAVTVTVTNNVIIAAWNYTVASPYAPDWPATSGTNMAGTTLEFFYASGAQATLATAVSNPFINVPNIGGNTVANGWFRTPEGQGNATTPAEPITVQNSAGWVIALSTTGYENITFSAHQSASNNGPSQFRLAYRLDEDGTWTEFGDMVTIPGADVDGGGILHPTITNVPLPATVNDQSVVQVRVWIATNARRSDGTYVLAANNGNHSINNIVFMGDEIY
jgi:hypothetical protein